jgi:uncharacterized phage protein (TIGR01671 family)
MNRELKIRIWTTEQMIPFHQILDDNIDILRPDKRDITMQYTGLKDSKGVEIYEGDVVLNHSNLGAKYLIEYNKTGFRGIAKEGDNFGPYTLNLYINDQNPKLEVIGNIYENPKLLK